LGKYIKVTNQYDRQAFMLLRATGHATGKQLKKCGISDTKIKNWCREKAFEKVPYQVKGQEQNQICYRLTSHGREVGAEKWGLKNYAQNTISHERHNLDVAEKYVSLSVSERESVRNEIDLREIVQERIYEIEQKNERDQYQELLDQGAMSMPDITYTTTEGVTIAYETTTNNYSEVEIQAKEETCQFLNIELEQHKI
jgi:hypothetical protein